MSNIFIGEIRGFANSFCPQGWLPCDGSLQPIAQYQPLFAVIGTTYGGNGTTTFGLPNLQGTAMLSAGASPGLTSYTLGEQAGTPAVALNSTQMPQHNHTVTGINNSVANTYAAPIDQTSNLSRVFASSNSANAYSDQPANVQMAPQTLMPTNGVSQAHENRQPLLPFIYGIAWDGVFPQPA